MSRASCPKCGSTIFVRHEVADIEEYDLCISCDHPFNVRRWNTSSEVPALDVEVGDVVHDDSGEARTVRSIDLIDDELVFHTTSETSSLGDCLIVPKQRRVLVRGAR